ncbi:hypothetical protein Q5P01_009373 [Channa striata]|uniref:Uncharacterized protein n=1 Tax=Channa striata TaxID=64152 RepID=A0AA88N477_CHASR|nr:hypothetical protein Q5P01_009373 [Channa striata]
MSECIQEESGINPLTHWFADGHIDVHPPPSAIASSYFAAPSNLRWSIMTRRILASGVEIKTCCSWI